MPRPSSLGGGTVLAPNGGPSSRSRESRQSPRGWPPSRLSCRYLSPVSRAAAHAGGSYPPCSYPRAPPGRAPRPGGGLPWSMGGRRSASGRIDPPPAPMSPAPGIQRRSGPAPCPGIVCCPWKSAAGGLAARPDRPAVGVGRRLEGAARKRRARSSRSWMLSGCPRWIESPIRRKYSLAACSMMRFAGRRGHDAIRQLRNRRARRQRRARARSHLAVVGVGMGWREVRQSARERRKHRIQHGSRAAGRVPVRERRGRARMRRLRREDDRRGARRGRGGRRPRLRARSGGFVSARGSACRSVGARRAASRARSPESASS